MDGAKNGKIEVKEISTLQQHKPHGEEDKKTTEKILRVMRKKLIKVNEKIFRQTNSQQ